jgi:hypothetical protein
MNHLITGLRTLIDHAISLPTIVPEPGLGFGYARARVAPGSLSCCHRQSGFLVLEKGKGEDGSVKSEENRIETLNLAVRCLPHQHRTGSALLTDIRLREEEVRPPDRRL